LGQALPLRAWNDEDRDALKDFMHRSGGPHAIIWTHADEVNQALLDFIGHRAGSADRTAAWRRTDAPADPL
jgi:hypothetical protein